MKIFELGDSTEICTIVVRQLNSEIQSQVPGEACLTMPELLSDWSTPGGTHVCRGIGLPPSNRNASINSHTQEGLAMNCKLITAFVLPLLVFCSIGSAQKQTSDIPYVENGHERQVLDIYTSESAAGGSLPVMFCQGQP